MITDSDRFRQDRSPYERPNYPYRCGRLSFWGKPCGRGPSSDGACGGVSECTPYFSNDRWECRRSVRNGGPCETGPLPDGQCCNQHKPCKPILSLRGYRGRLTMLAAALVIALIAAFGFTGDYASAVSTVSPGELSGAHSKFTSAEGCATCHTPHALDAANWLKASWSPGGLSNACGSCHTFNGGATAPHNEKFETAGGARQTQCTSCHTEHQGQDGGIIKIKDAQCNACHQKTFGSFSDGHPAFGKTFPARRRTAIAFNHTSHFSKHFQDQRFEERAPKERCVSCHDVSRAGRNVPVKAFEETCARCHESQIGGRELVVFTLPEFEKDPFDAESVREACGPSAASLDKAGDIVKAAEEKIGDLPNAQVTVELKKDLDTLRFGLGLGGKQPKSDKDYESVSLETLPTTAVMLLDIEDGDDMGAYSEPVRDLVMGMIEDGGAALAKAVEDRPEANLLFSGVPSDLLHRAGCAWASNEEYESAADPVAGGWFADALSLKYQPVRHRDAVAKAWIDMVAAGGKGVSDDMRDAILSPSDSPGACTKCHSVNQVEGDEKKLEIGWSLGAVSQKRHVKYSHVPHLNLLGIGQACESCHKMDETAEFAAAFKQNDPHKFASNFKSIENATCLTCHKEGEVRQECTLCHEYHNGHGFKRRMSDMGMESKKPGG
jgi:hypothetical protein